MHDFSKTKISFPQIVIFYSAAPERDSSIYTLPPLSLHKWSVKSRQKKKWNSRDLKKKKKNAYYF